MPNIRSAAKAMRSSARKHAQNKSIKSALKTSVSKAQKLLPDGATEKAGPALTAASSALDKAAQKGVIHPNKAARLKSRMAKKLGAAQKASAAAAAAALSPEPEQAKPKRRTTRAAKPKA